MANPEMAECIICGEEKEVSMWIQGYPMDEGCVHEGIVSKFVNALRHEAEYPVRWGQAILQVKDFLHFIEDPDEFMVEWEKKVREYEMPIALRLYCDNCQTFVDRKDQNRLIRFGCSKCKALLCSACGMIDHNDGVHQCEKPTSDPYEGLVRGKDFQISPNSECQMKVELWDGCNAMTCTSASCGQAFCFICGEFAPHDGTHWTAGSKCPRWNQPGTSNAQYDRVATPPTTAAAVIERMQRSQGLVQDLPRMVRRLPLLPPLPHIAGDGEHPAVARLQAEMNMAPALLDTEFGRLMLDQQSKVDATPQVAQAMIIDAENDDKQAPAFIEAAIDIMLKLQINLNILVWRERLAVDIEHYRRRHDEMHTLMNQHHREIKRHFPGLLSTLWLFCCVSTMRGGF